MGVVIGLQRKEPEQPTLAGEARCLTCRHEWVAVAPVGTTWLECPECKCVKGVLKYKCLRDAPLWTCACGNDLFHVTAEGVYCPNCGNWQKGF